MAEFPNIGRRLTTDSGSTVLRKYDERIQRADQLARIYPFASEILGFYSQLAAFQRVLHEQLKSGNIDDLLPHFPALLRLIERVGPSGLAGSATRLAQQENRWAAMLSSYWNAEDRDSVAIDELESVLVRTMLQPYAEFLAVRSDVQPDVVRNTCPFCGELPQVGILRPEGDGAKRSLLCGLCSTEWQFRRTLCPNCGEESTDKLPVYIAAEYQYVRVEACDTCTTYIKSIDLTKDGHAVPVVDELATLPLNAWAEERGYTKISPNLLGL
jgi:FdhE protein